MTLIRCLYGYAHTPSTHGKLHSDACVSVCYAQLIFPFSGDMLQDGADFGSVWLTKAFQAFGSISNSNSVKIVNVRSFVGGGAASKAILTVSYSSPDEGC